MRLIISHAILFCTLTLAASSAQAGPKPWIFGWWPSHWDDLNFEQPYTYDGKSRHNRQWDHRAWQPSDWISQRAGGLELIDSWYKVGILNDQYFKNDVPVLEVGPAFHTLGGFDKRRVTAVIDNVYKVTANRPNGIFHLRDHASGKYIGLYTQYGLMLE
jgi:hypothetical protein